MCVPFPELVAAGRSNVASPLGVSVRLSDINRLAMYPCCSPFDTTKWFLDVTAKAIRIFADSTRCNFVCDVPDTCCCDPAILFCWR